MKQLHIKFTVNTQMLQSYCNTSGLFTNKNNGRPLDNMQEGAQAIQAYATRMQNLAALMVNVDATERYYRDILTNGGETDCQTVTAAIKSLIAGAFSIDEKHLHTTTYTKNKEAITCHIGTITIQIIKM